MLRVPLTIVGDAQEAEIACGLLRSAGIDCGHRETDVAVGRSPGYAGGGPREILVDPARLDDARVLLADIEE